MPITIKDAPKPLPAHGKEIYVAAFNSAYDDTCKTRSDRDECAAKIAWSAVKKKYKKVGEDWVSKAAHVEVELVITKASLQADGTMRWQGVASDTSQDLANDRTTLALFHDWVERVDTGQALDFLPPPRQPFLGLSHYPSLDGFGEAGLTDKLYVDGNRFKVGGQFKPTPLGKALFEAVRAELDLIKRGESPEDPIRISAAWWDVQHAHGDFKFTRTDLVAICPMCADGAPRAFLKGQLDHFASTRVPMNPRTSLGLEEKSMAKVTRHDDAASIVPDELADELEERAKEELVGKSATETTDALVIKAEGDETAGGPIGSAGMIEETKAVNKDTLPPTEKAVEIEVVEPWKPYGGATSIAEAQSWLDAQELEWKVYDAWSMFRAVMENILDDEDEPDKLGAVRKAIAEFGNSVEVLKSRASDAYLVRPIVKGATIMTEDTKPVIPVEDQAAEETPKETAPLTPGQAFWASIETAAADPTKNREQMVAEAQTALEQLAQAAKTRIDMARPPDVTEELKSMLATAIDARIGPLAEKIELLLVKQQVPATPAMPHQKSITAPAAQYPAAPVARSQIEMIARRSVGLTD